MGGFQIRLFSYFPEEFPAHITKIPLLFSVDCQIPEDRDVFYFIYFFFFFFFFCLIIVYPLPLTPKLEKGRVH